MNKIGYLVIAVVCYFGAKALVTSMMGESETPRMTDSERERVFMEEAAESGIDADAGKTILDASTAIAQDKQKIASLEAAYGDARGKSTKEVRQYLNSNLEVKTRVGHALVETIKEGMNLPVQLDEYTAITGLHYSPPKGSVVYHYRLADEVIMQFAGNYDELKAAIESINPDAVCKLSLELLGQGFDMTYSYRDSAGTEVVSVVKTYEDCERMGFNKYS